MTIREKINALRAYYGAGPTTMTDEQIAAGQEIYGAKKDVDMTIIDELYDNRTTELRKLLNERGVNYDENSRRHSHVFLIDYCNACGDYLSEIEVYGACICATKKYLTPDEAIAVILGNNHEIELKDALNFVSDKWAIAQIQAADSAKRCKLLEELVRDLWEGFECDRCPLYGDDCWWKQGDELKPCRMMNRMRGLGIEAS